MIVEAETAPGKWSVRKERLSRQEIPCSAGGAWEELFPDFELGRLVTRCGDHELYAATIRVNQSPCLLLLVAAGAFRNEEHRAAFLTGLTEVTALRQPHLLSLLWTGMRAGHVGLGYEFFDGQSLFAVMDYYRLDPLTAVGITAAMGGALHAGHEKGIQHRDFNPGWVLMNESGSVRVIGMGVMPLLSESDRGFYEILLRRPEYLRPYVAPEQINLSEPSDHVSDVHALGMIAYELLVGHPIGGGVILPSARAAVGTSVDQAIFRALHASREMRYQSAVHFGHDVQQIYAAHNNKHLLRRNGSDQASAAALRKKRRKLTWLGLAAAALAISAGGVAWWHLHVRTPREAAVAVLDEAGRERQLNDLAGTISRNKDGLSKEEKEMVLASAAAVLRTMMGMAQGTAKTDQVLVASELLMQGGMEELSLEALLKLQVEAPPDSVDWRRVEAITQLMLGGRKGYREAAAAAEEAGKAGDAPRERTELARAAGFIPGRIGLAGRAGLNGYDPVPGLKAVLEGMRGSRTGGSVQYALRTDGLLLQVDLANNPGLRDLQALSGFPITHLDVSGTSVADLAPLAGMPLQVLRLDRTPVASLAPLNGGPLRVLTAEHCAIRDDGNIDQWLVMEAYRITLSDGTLRTRDGFPHWGRSWVNSLGLAFQPVAPRDPLLVASGEIRFQDFRSYLDHLPAPGADAAGGERKPARPALPGRAGPYQKSPGHPVTGVTWREALEFCGWLTRTEQAKGLLNSRSSYRLMTSREWDLAAGVATSGSEEALPLANHQPLFSLAGNLPPAFQIPFPTTGPGRFSIVPSGTFRSQSGLLDLGNQVREWCADIPAGAGSGQAADTRVIRDFGGQISPWVLRSRDPLRAPAMVGSAPATVRREDIGFRIVLQLPPVHALTE